MIISVTSEYALRAMVFLAKQADVCPIPGPRIAASANVPRKYLSAILADLVRIGLLEGTRGKNGGFKLTRKPRKIRLSEILAPFEPISAARKSCPFGNAVCGDVDPCAAHEQWKEVNASITGFLENTTLEAVARMQSERAAGKRSTRSTR